MEDYRKHYEEYRKKLFSYVMRMTGDYDLSRDIVQESFARSFERYGYQKVGMALLYTIARNALFDYKRKMQRQVPFPEDIEDCSRSQEYSSIVREEYHKVLNAMQKLENDERDLFALVLDGELSYRDIASISGISEANVKVRVHRIRLKLRDFLKEGEE